MAFYEPFNEMLAGITREKALEFSPSSWNSRHADAAPYFKEYLPLIGEDGGVAGMLHSFSFERYVPAQGFDGDISNEEVAYLDALVELARASNKVPVFGCCRSLGRMQGMRRKFGGTHVFAYRGLFEEWTSYISQYEHDNPYFLVALRQIVSLNSHVDGFSEVRRRWLTDDGSGFIGFNSARAACKSFLAVHAILYANGHKSADITISTGLLSLDDDYRQTATSDLKDSTGLSVSFAGAHNELAGVHCDLEVGDISEVHELVLSYLSEEPSRAFARKLLSDFAAMLLVAKKSSELASTLNSEAQRLRIELERSQLELHAIRNSRSWSITAPLRKAASLVRRS